MDSDEEMLDNIARITRSISPWPLKGSVMGFTLGKKNTENLKSEYRRSLFIDFAAEAVSWMATPSFLVCYTVDEDENDETTGDRNAYLSIYNSDA